ncbi:DUF4381 domain-containing protein [Shewanella goraebulensis]|uniref:DUF4381 domain-containing protein n=1 Tax=Shewanella goraebulensis TaxID=3050637 RepID=UPI002550C5B2|nr:DUF4381 domain-containing protein [Shewanella goraebulensis]
MSQFNDTWGSNIVKELIETTPPEAINWWPQTLGWQVVAFFLFIIFLRKLYLRWRLYQHNVYRRDAIAWLNQLPPFEKLSTQPIFRQLPNLLRKTALGGYQRTEIANLSGNSWAQWLDEQCTQSSFGEDGAFMLHRLAYDSDWSMTSDQMDSLTQKVRLWIEHHRGVYD